MTILQRLLDEAESFAREWYRSHPRHEFIATFVAMNSAGRRYIYVTPFSGEASKVATIAQLRTAFREHQIIAYAMLSETWISPSLNARIMESGEPIDELPGQQPDREERFYISAADGSKTVGRMFRMVRDHKNRVVDLTLDDEHESEGNKVGGRMSELLDP